MYRPLPAVICRDLSKTFGDGSVSTTALRQVRLDVRFGELTMLTGPAGSGKSSLVSIVAGIVDQDDGECLVLGRRLRLMNLAERIKFRGSSIGLAVEVCNLLPSVSIAENVALPLLVQGVVRDEALHRAGAALARVGLSQWGDMLPSGLTAAERQRVAIARALVYDPALIVCDDPTTLLDRAAGARMMALLREIAHRPNRAVLIATRDPRNFDFADRIAYMEEGRILRVIEQPAA